MAFDRIHASQTDANHSKRREYFIIEQAQLVRARIAKDRLARSDEISFGSSCVILDLVDGTFHVRFDIALMND